MPNKRNKNISNYVVFDFETGGLRADKNPVLEATFLALQRNAKGLYVDKEFEVDSLILPYAKKLKIDQQALEVNGLTRKQIKEFGNPVDVVVQALMEMLKEINPKNEPWLKPILVGHNIDEFDLDFLDQMLDYGSDGKMERLDYFAKTTFDTLTVVKHLLGNNKTIGSFSLINVCKFMGIEITNAHRSYDDTYANALLFIKLQKAFGKLTRKDFLNIKL